MDVVAQHSIPYGGDDTLDLQHGRESLALVDGPASVMVLGGHAAHARVETDEIDKVSIAKPDSTVKVPKGAQIVFSPVAGGIRLGITRDTDPESAPGPGLTDTGRPRPEPKKRTPRAKAKAKG